MDIRGTLVVVNKKLFPKCIHFEITDVINREQVVRKRVQLELIEKLNENHFSLCFILVYDFIHHRIDFYKISLLM